MRSYFQIFILIIFLTNQLVVSAGGPLEVRKGKALSYGKKPFVYKYDRGNLGKLTNDEAIALVESLFTVWETVSTASIIFKRGNPGFLKFDVNANNFIPILRPKTDKDLNGFTPIVFDDDGTILDSYIGQGASKISVGIGGPVVLKHGSRFSIPESQIVLNGKFINGIDTKDDPEASIELFKRAILHEIGHAIGLDHSQINDEAISPFASKEIKESVPLMFPKGANDLSTITQDDASALSYLYPNSVELVNFGTIEGKIFREDGKTPVLGANVVLRNVNNPLLNAISCVSDFLANNTGSFVFFAVPPGSYTVEIEPINPAFVSGSSAGPKVGPYTKNSNDKSFQNPVPEGFYTGSNQSVTNDPTKALIIKLEAGQKIKDINIVAKVE